MSPALAQRLVAIAAVGLLVVAIGLAVDAQRGDSSSALPESIPAPDGGWYEARVAASGRDLEQGTTTECGHSVGGSTIGVAHPVLPCGVKLYLGYRDQEVLTQVIARGPEAPNLRFGLSDALARELAIDGTATIRWRYAR